MPGQINPEFIIKNRVLETCEFTKTQQVGIDLTIAEEVIVHHGEAKNVLLNEVVRLPKDIFAMLYGRSSYNRRGVLIRGSVYDPGYCGQIGATIYNMSGDSLVFPKNERICQIVFFEADSASEYKGQYQNENLNVESAK